MAGGRLDGPTMIFHIEFFLMFSIVLLFPHMDIILLGIFLVMADAVIGIFINGRLGALGDGNLCRVCRLLHEDNIFPDTGNNP